MTTLSLKRSGSFTALPEQMTVHACEGKDKREFRYEVEIVTKGQNLTPEGFILDTQVVMDYFREKYEGNREAVLSCELMAWFATTHFGTILSNTDDLLRISVTISTHDESSFTATFENA